MREKERNRAGAKQEQCLFLKPVTKARDLTHATRICLTTTQEVAVGDKAVAGDEAKETKK